MVDYGEPCQVCNLKDIRARKNHACTECGRTIFKGEVHEAGSVLSDNEWSSHRICAHCQVARKWLDRTCGGYCLGGVKADLLEHIDEGYDDKFLVNVVRGIERKWTKRNGDLMPLPDENALPEYA